MPYAKSTSHRSRGLAKLLTQYQGKRNIEAWIGAYLDRIQELENAIYEVIYYRLFSDAEGAQLDGIGTILCRGRGGTSLIDADYYRLLQAQMAIINSNGTPDDLIRVTELSLPISATFVYGEHYPATVHIGVTSGGISVATIEGLFLSLSTAKMGGVRLLLSWSADPDEAFTFADAGVPMHDHDLGMGDAYPSTIGGKFSFVLDTV